MSDTQDGKDAIIYTFEVAAAPATRPSPTTASAASTLILKMRRIAVLETVAHFPARWTTSQYLFRFSTYAFGPFHVSAIATTSMAYLRILLILSSNFSSTIRSFRLIYYFFTNVSNTTAAQYWRWPTWVHPSHPISFSSSPSSACACT